MLNTLPDVAALDLESMTSEERIELALVAVHAQGTHSNGKTMLPLCEAAQIYMVL
jgi:hypothetical protein